MKKNFFFLIALLSSFLSLGQSASGKADSLRGEIANADTSEYDQLFSQLLTQGKKLPPDQDIADAQKTIDAARQASDSAALIYAYRNLGNAYTRADKRGEALSAFQKGYDLAVISKGQRELGMIAFRLSSFYMNEQFYTEALEKLYEAITVFQKLNDTESLYRACLLNSNINYRTKNFDASIKEANKAQYYFRNLKTVTRSDSFELMSSRNTVGLSAFQMKKYEESKVAFAESEEVAMALKNEFWIGLINGNRSKIYRAQGYTDMAIQNLKRDFAISKKFNEWASACVSAASLADIYIDEKKIDIAGRYLDTVNSILPKIKTKITLLNAARLRARYYEIKGDLAKTVKAQKEVMQLKDSLTAENEKSNLGRFRARYELEKKQTEIASLKYSNELQETKIENQRVIIWATGIILALVVLLILVIIRDSFRMKSQYTVISQQRAEIENKNDELEAQSHTLQQQNEIIGSINLKLEEKVRIRTEELDAANRELDRFLYHASHDIRRPIATLLGLEQVFQLSGREHWQMLFEKVSDVAHSMDSMLFKLHMAYELNRPTGERYTVHLHDVIDESITVFDTDFQRRNIDCVHVRGAAITFSSNKDLLQVIMRNLIENTISFRKPHIEERPFVRISSCVKNEMLTIEVEDNGIGIDAQYTERIFDLYFRGTQQSKGNGVGLYLAKKAANMLGGDIEVQSEWGTGSVFRVHLPIK